MLGSFTGAYTPYSKMATILIIFIVMLIGPRCLHRIFIQNSKEFLAGIEALRAN